LTFFIPPNSLNFYKIKKTSRPITGAKSLRGTTQFFSLLLNGFAGGAYYDFSLQLKDEDFQQIHPMDSHQPPLSE
jgi:hypothetical protein